MLLAHDAGVDDASCRAFAASKVARSHRAFGGWRQGHAAKPSGSVVGVSNRARPNARTLQRAPATSGTGAAGACRSASRTRSRAILALSGQLELLRGLRSTRPGNRGKVLDGGPNRVAMRMRGLEPPRGRGRVVSGRGRWREMAQPLDSSNGRPAGSHAIRARLGPDWARESSPKGSHPGGGQNVRPAFSSPSSASIRVNAARISSVSELRSSLMNRDAMVAVSTDRKPMPTSISTMPMIRPWIVVG